MNLNRLGWPAVFLLNAAWFLLLPTRSGRLVACAGSFLTAAILLTPVLPSAIRGHLRVVFEYPRSSGRAVLLGIPFLLPALSVLGTPTVAVWILDGRAWLIVAWLVAAMSLASAASDAQREPTAASSASLPAATALFLFWSSVFWLSVVSDIGIGRFVFEVNREVDRSCQSDPLSVAFSIWESHPASEHLFLGWRTVESFEVRVAYANHVHPYMMAMYAVVRTVRLLGGVPTYVASNVTPFFYMFILLAGVTTLLARGGLFRDRNSLLSLLLMFLTYGLVITMWRFWNDLYRYTSDNPYPLLVAVLLFVYAFLLEPVRPVLATLSACLFVGLSPIYAPMLAVGVLLLFGRRDTTPRGLVLANRIPLVVTFASVSFGVIVYLIPRMLIAWRGYTPEASSFLFRSGLDGDTRYFSNMVQSVLTPCPVSCCWGRTVTDLLFPAFIPLAILGVFAWRGHEDKRIHAGHLLLFLCTPYLISLVFFPQSLSIHPYMYDHLLLIPVVVTGAVAMLTPSVEARLNRTWLLAFLLVISGVLMSNLIAITQGLAAMPARP